MTPEFAYLLKVNVAFVLFYAFYRLFFYKDTFFKLRRAILLAFFGLALFYPLLNIQDWVRQQEPIADVIYMYSAMLPEATAKADAAASVDWYGWLLGSLGFIYWGIVAFLCGRFLVQLSSILWLAHTSERVVIHETPMPNTRFAVSSYLTSSFPLLLARKARMLGLQLNSLAGKSTSRVRPRLVKVRKPQLVKKTGMKHEGQEDPAAELYWLRHQKGQEGSDSHRSDTGWGHCP